jgi:hypothetical protein
MLVKGVELVWSKFVADLEQHVRICLLKLGARLAHAIDMSKEGALIDIRAAGHGLQLPLFVLQRVVMSEQRGFVLGEDRIHVGLLVGAEMQGAGEILIVPPAARWSQLQAAPHGAARGAVCRP